MSKAQGSRKATFTEKDFRENGIIEKNVKCIFIGALEEGNEELQAMCIAFMRNNLNCENCFQFLGFATKYKCELLINSIYFLILQFIDVFTRKPAFLDLSLDEMKSLVDKSSSFVDSKELLIPALLAGIIGWVKHAPKERTDSLCTLAKQLELDAVDSKSLKVILWDDDFVRNNDDCRALYLETIHNQYFKHDPQQGNCSTTPVSGFSGHVMTNNLARMSSAENSGNNNRNDVSSSDIHSSDWVIKEEGHSSVAKRSSKRVSNKSCRIGADAKSINSVKSSLRVTLERVKKLRKTRSPNAVQEKLELRKRQQLTKSGLSFDRTEKRRSTPPPPILKVEAPATMECSPFSSSTNSKPALHSNERSIAYFLTGWHIPELMSFDIKTNGPVKKVTDFNCDHDQVSMIYHCGQIYCLGGTNDYAGKVALKTVRKFDLGRNKWITCPSMKEVRCHFKPTLLNGRIYAIAGNDGLEIMNCVEYLDITSNSPKSWQEADFPDRARSDYGITAVNGLIYIVGGLYPKRISNDDSDNSDSDGYSPDDVEATNTMESYNPLTDKWSAKCSVPIPLFGPIVTADEARQCLYCFGGSTKERGARLNRAFVYYLKKDRWVELQPMIERRRSASSIILGEFIYVMGGNEGKIPNIERYDIAKNAWEIIRNSKLPYNGWYENVAFGDNHCGS